jgi:hypothetical protein
LTSVEKLHECLREEGIQQRERRKEEERLTLSPSMPFMLDLTITRVSRSSVSIFARSDFRTSGLTNMIPFGETERGRVQLEKKEGKCERRTRDVVLEEVKKAVGEVAFAHAQLLGALKVLDATEACRVAVVIGDHDGRVERLEVKDEERTLVERRLRFHDERHALGGILLPDLLAVGRKKHEALRLRNLEHDGLDLELTTASADRVEVDAEDSSRLAVRGEKVGLRKERERRETHQVWSMTSAASRISMSISTRFLQ